jgi:hypothetical protein
LNSELFFQEFITEYFFFFVALVYDTELQIWEDLCGLGSFEILLQVENKELKEV